MNSKRVFIDTCVFVPISLSNLILRMAEREIFIPLWSTQVLDELTRTCGAMFGISFEPHIQKRIHFMNRAFPDALLKEEFIPDPAINFALPDENDVPILISALKGSATEILTFNTRDFPNRMLQEVGIECVNPDKFLLDYLHSHGVLIREIVDSIFTDFTRPKISKSDYISNLSKLVPNFAAELEQLYASTLSEK